jgi:hypothetical protein
MCRGCSTFEIILFAFIINFHYWCISEFSLCMVCISCAGKAWNNFVSLLLLHYLFKIDLRIICKYVSRKCVEENWGRVYDCHQLKDVIKANSMECTQYWQNLGKNSEEFVLHIVIGILKIHVICLTCRTILIQALWWWSHYCLEGYDTI